MADLKDKVLIYSSLFPRVKKNHLAQQFKKLGYSQRGISKVISSLKKEGWLEQLGTSVEDEEVYRSLADFSAGWDEKFRLVLFDVPEEQRQIRDAIRNYIKKLGAGQWQRSVWVIWRPLPKGFWDKLSANGWARYVYVVETVSIAGVSSAVQFASKVWNLEDLNKRYSAILEDWQEGYTKYQDDAEELSVLANKLTAHYLDAASEDPFLPPQLLFSDWHGEEARRLIASLEKVKLSANTGK